MRDLIEKTGRHGVAFAASLMLSRVVGFALMPFLTHALDGAEYGVADHLAILGQVLALIGGQGVPSAVFRGYAYTSTTDDERARVVATGFRYIVLSAVVVMGLAALGSRPLSWVATRTVDHWAMVLVVLATYALAMARNVCTQVLRAEYRSRAFLAVYCGEFVLCAGLNLLLVVGMDLGFRGILYSNLIGAAFAAALGVLFVPEVLRPNLDWGLVRGFRRFGWPLILPGIAFLLLDSIDRFFFRWLLPDGMAVSGVYGRGMTVASILQGALIMPLSSLWPGIYYPLARRATAAADLAVCGSWYAAIAGLLATGLAVVARPLVEVMTGDAQYHVAWVVVPILCLSLAASGASEIFKVGLLVHDQTRVLPRLMVVCVALNALVNVALIPVLGLTGAAWSSVAAYALLAVLVLRASQRHLPIAHEWGRWAKAGVAAAVCYAGCAAVDVHGEGTLGRALEIGARGGAVLVVYPALLIAMRFPTDRERRVIGEWIRARRGRLPGG